MASAADRAGQELARLLAGEDAVSAATLQALQVLLDHAETALRQAGYDTAVLDSRYPGWRTSLTDDVEPAIADVFRAAWEATQRGVIDPEPYAARHLETVHNRLVGVADETFDVMRLQIEEGRQAQESIPELAARVDALLADTERWTNRATVIARTEVIAANNMGAHGSARATADLLGIGEDQVVKEWLATEDSRTRRTHKRADGQQVRGADATFTVGRADLLVPGDPRGRAEEVIQCRCTVMYLFPGDPDYPDRLRASGVKQPDEATVTALPERASSRPAAAPAASTTTTPAATVTRAAAGETVVPGRTGVVSAEGLSDQQRMARALTDTELRREANRRRGSQAARDVARAELQRRGLTAAADQEDPVDTEHTSVVVVALPADDDPVHGIGPEQKHATLLFLGEAATLPEGSRSLLEQVLTLAAETYEPVVETVTDVAPLGDDGAHVWMLAGDALPELRGDLLDVDTEVVGLLDNAEQYPEFTPHVTIGYEAGNGTGDPANDADLDEPDDATDLTDDNLDEARQVESIRFDRLALWWAGDQVDYPLAGVSDADVPVQATTQAASRRPSFYTEQEMRAAAADANGGEPPLPEPTHAGIAVQAEDTGRILLIQRWWDEDDAPEVRGTWEFPGGTIEDGETPLDAAWREFGEETGLPRPPYDVEEPWLTPDGVYLGHRVATPVEADAFPLGINPDPDNRPTTDPDNPDERRPDVQAWFTLEQLDDLGAALRPEVRDNTEWLLFAPTPQQEDPVTTDNLAAAMATVRAAGYGLMRTSGVVTAQASTLQAAEGDPVAPEVPETPVRPAAPGTPPTASDIDPDAGQPFYGIMWPEGVMSGDGRAVDVGATEHRDLPLPIMAQDAQAMGHDGAVRVGRLDTLVRDDTTYSVPVMRYTGVWDTSPAAIETARQVDAGMVRGISTDGDAVDVELRGTSGAVLDPMVDDFPEDGVVVEVATAARVSGGTVCSIPAFHQAYIANGVLEDRTDPEPGWNEDGTPKDNVLTPPTGEPVDGEPALVASAAWSLAQPETFTVPAAFFARPDALDANLEGTPLTITPEGHVYGHLATWGTCHVGVSGMCQEPPSSPTNYAYFTVGSVLADDGTTIPTGPLVMDTTHASLRASAARATQHYDDTGRAVADLAVGEDAIGIWYSGMIRPGTTEAQVYALRAGARCSGDWRNLGGFLELVANLAVNTNGFPIPRPAITASAGQPQAMVAAGMVPARRAPQPGAGEAATVSAVIAALDRRERAQKVAARLHTTHQRRRTQRATAAAARITERA